MRRSALMVAAIASAAATAHAAPSASTVVTDLGEVRACLPLAGGDTLVGTGGGLARVDATGSVRAVWTAVDGLPGTRIDSIAQVGTALWIGTEQGAAQVTLAEVAMTVGVKAGTSSIVDAVAVGGTTYLATADRGVIDAHGTTLRFRDPAKGAARLATTSLVGDGTTLYVGTAAGLYQLRAGKLDRVALAAGAEPAVTALALDGAVLWIATTTGLLSRDATTVHSYGGGELRHVTMLDGAVIATGLDGSVTVDRGRLVAAASARAPASVLLQALHGADGAACAGGLDGLWLRPSARAAWTHVDPPAGPPANDLSALAVDGERLYVGTFDHGLALYEHGTWRTLAAATGNPTAPPFGGAAGGGTAATGDPTAPPFGGAAGGGTAATGNPTAPPFGGAAGGGTAATGDPTAPPFGGAAGGGTAATVDRRINALAVDRRDHRVWIATAAGLSTLDPETGVVVTLGKRDGMPARGALSLTQLRDGRMLVGTLHGAAIVGDGRPQILGGKDELAVTNVWAVAEDDAGYLWLGTTSGLYRGKATDTAWTRFSVSTGHLADDWVMALAPHGDSIDVGMYKGGVTRLEHVDEPASTAVTATHLGDGYVNPGGLAWDGTTLLASTMAGLRSLDASGAWTTVARIPGHDVTAVARIGRTRFVASRRGLAIMTGA